MPPPHQPQEASPETQETVLTPKKLQKLYAMKSRVPELEKYNGNMLIANIHSKKHQKMYLVGEKGNILEEYPISGASKGQGDEKGSDMTPSGFLKVGQKIGGEAPKNTVFSARENTGQIAKLANIDTNKDLVTSRIMWMEGFENGRNKGGNQDAKGRFTYIHGTNEEFLLGTPASHGCIRMSNENVITLFGLVDKGTPVFIPTKSEVQLS